MPKVIGFDPKLMKQCKCTKCAAIIEYSDNELREFKYSDYGGGSNICQELICPNCGNKIQWDI